MSTWGKAVTLVLVSLFLTLVLLIPLITNGQIASSYNNNSPVVNPIAFTLTINSPYTQNQTFSSTMSLNFTIQWTEYPTFYPITSPPAPAMNAVYNYTIDNNQPVTVTSNQSSSDIFDLRNFKVNPTFSYSVNLSNLTDGYHKIVITAKMYSSGSISFTASSDPVFFLVQNPTPSPTPTPTVPELSWLIVIPLFIVVLCSVVIVRHRKSVSLSK
jgi:hypothetical protein